MPMTKGFPRPSKYIKKVKARLEVNRSIFSGDEKWDDKHYPMPYTGQVHQIGLLAFGRVRECKKNNLCIVCGYKVEEEKPWVYIYQNHLVDDSGPFHEKCAKLTQSICPFVNENPTIFRFTQIPWENLANGLVPAELTVPLK